MTAKKQKNYDDQELCEAIAIGTLTTKGIASRFHISESMVTKIASGAARPELKPIVEKIKKDQWARLRMEVKREFRRRFRSDNRA